MMNEGVVIVVEVDEKCIDKCIEIKYCDCKIVLIEEVLVWVEEVKLVGKFLFIVFFGNVVEVYYIFLNWGVKIDIVID